MMLPLLTDWLRLHLTQPAVEQQIRAGLDASAGQPCIELELPAPPRPVALHWMSTAAVGVYATYWRAPLAFGVDEYMGFGPLRVVRTRGALRFQQALAQVRAAGGNARWFGGFAFDDVRQSDALFGNELVLHHVAWHRGPDGPTLTIRGPADPGLSAAQWVDSVMRACHGDAAARSSVQNLRAQVLRQTHDPDELFTRTVRDVLAHIEEGTVDKVVPARLAILQPSRIPSAAAVIERLDSHFPMCTVYAFGGADELFVGATPELLLAHDGQGGLQSMALAGTAVIAADASPDTIRHELLDSAKDTAEHLFVVDHIRQTMLRSGASVQTGVTDVIRLPSLMHMHTALHARVSDPAVAADLLAALHPTPAVCGKPTGAAMEILRNHESFDRGWFAAPVGWASADGSFDFRVALRCALICPPVVALFAGAGIVRGSDVAHELQETQWKMRAMRSALGVDE
jgi:menaquinone-specific isochorismate synthase